MEPQSENRIVLIIRQTRLDELIARFNTIGQAKFYVEHLGADFSDYQEEDDHYKNAFRQTEDALRKLGRVHVLQRKFLPNFIFGKEDTIVVLGQDGLVANTLKYLNGQPVMGINPDPRRWDGVLLPFTVDDVEQVIPEVFSHGREFKEITMAKAQINNGQVLYGVNDLFIGPKTHGSARYVLKIGGKQEQQSSSGIIISTGLGSTGWLKSILAGAKGIAGYAVSQPIQLEKKCRITWSSNYLFYTVREPFPSKSSEATLVFGKITSDNPMAIMSQMPENEAVGFAEIFTALNCSLNKQLEIITLVKEIGILENKSISTILTEDRIHHIVSDLNTDKNVKTRQLRSDLRRWRYPHITETEKAFFAQVEKLGLSERLRLIPPQDFEGDTYRLTFDFKSLQELKDHQKKLDEIISHPELIKILS